jgi:hypothetical protein
VSGWSSPAFNASCLPATIDIVRVLSASFQRGCLARSRYHHESHRRCNLATFGCAGFAQSWERVSRMFLYKDCVGGPIVVLSC